MFKRTHGPFLGEGERQYDAWVVAKTVSRHADSFNMGNIENAAHRHLKSRGKIESATYFDIVCVRNKYCCESVTVENASDE